MSAVSLPVSRSGGRALIVGNPACRSQPLAVLQQLGFTCAEVDDPYHAASELFRRPMVYGAVVLSLANLFKEELQLIGTVRRRMPHVDIWLSHIEGRHASLAEAQRLGADGLVGDDGLHRTAATAGGGAVANRPSLPARSSGWSALRTAPADDAQRDDEPDTHLAAPGEAVLTADELRALLQEQPVLPPLSDR